MQDSTVCPYFDHDEDICDVGCGYISSHDASMIIKFCSCQYQNCQKYRQLSERLDTPQELLQDTAPTPLKPASIEERLPILGLASYGITVACYSLDKLPVISMGLHLLAIILMLGAIGQISAGLNNLKDNPLMAIALNGSGLFWLSILALDILPRAGYGSVPGAIPMMGYFAMWGMFNLIICQGIEQITRACRVAFAMMTAFLLILAMSYAISSTALLHVAAMVGLASSLPGIYLALRYAVNETIDFLRLHVVRSEKIRS